MKDIHSDKLFFSNCCQLMEYQYSYFSGLDREYSFTNRGGSAWGHQSGEERNSISRLLWTVAVTSVLAVVLHLAMGFLSHLTIVLEGKNCQY